MLKATKILLVILLYAININGQNVVVKISGANSEAALSQIEGEKAEELFSVKLENGVYDFSLKGKHNGFYRLKLDKNHWIDFINDGNNIEIYSDIKNIAGNIKIIKSDANKLYYQFLLLNKNYKTKTELLNLILQRYPKDDNYYKTTLNKFEELKYDYSLFINVTSQKNPSSFVAKYIRSAQLPEIGGTLSFDKQMKYLKSHALDNIDFTDAELSYSDLFTNKSIEYLTYYQNNRLPKALLEKEFMSAVDTLLNKAKVNELVYQDMTEYLIDGFRKFGFDKIIDYIVNNYVIKDDICLDKKLKGSIQRRIDQSKFLHVGSSIPNIVIKDTKGNEINLSKIKSDKTLILFYASWCPHCKEIVPKISEFYKKQKIKNIEVLAVSIDTSKTDWMNFIRKNKLNWLNVSDLKGWFGKAANDYYLYATPTMFLINKNQKILAKPITIEEVKELF